MAGPGNPKGTNRGGGIPKGGKKRATLLKEIEELQRALHEAQAGAIVERNEGRTSKLPREVLNDGMQFFFALAAAHQPVEGNEQADAGKFEKYLDKAIDAAAKLAPYVHQKLATLTLVPQPVDLTKLTPEELRDWERLYTKASHAGGDTGGTIPPAIAA